MITFSNNTRFQRFTTGGTAETLYAENDGATLTTSGGGNRFAGQSRWTDGGTPINISRLDFKVTRAGGDLASSVFRAYIYKNAVSPNYDLDTTSLMATSTNGITGVNTWDATWLTFNFSPSFTTTASQVYVLCIAPEVSMVSNDLYTYSDNNVLVGYRDVFNNAGGASYGGGNDMAIKIYRT